MNSIESYAQVNENFSRLDLHLSNDEIAAPATLRLFPTTMTEVSQKDRRYWDLSGPLGVEGSLYCLLFNWKGIPGTPIKNVMILTPTGRVGINSASAPAQTLSVGGAIQLYSEVENEYPYPGSIRFINDKFQFAINSKWVDFNPSETFWMKDLNKVRLAENENYVAIGHNTPLSKLHVIGDAIQISGGTTANPDASKQGLAMGENTGNYAWLQTKSGLPLALNPVANNVSIGYIPGAYKADGYKLAVNGKIICEEIKVKFASSWPDFVFDAGYTLPSLKETENYIRTNKHLPGIPSAEEVKKDGFEAGQMNAALLQKIEELTLHLINQQKQIETLQKENAEIRKSIANR